ncbi:hypothetical protein EV356DRAFT_520678 [Viridothelium virens]|uniref:DNA/RNA-binding domain-containing protein n=1 Tax=Viridothelium virens TaxID=1048519 RepID=A0A6A6GVP8_VIRVR|nr:hypothetical protein EV356DRAFT_520678 [Viridothelium virens]
MQGREDDPVGFSQLASQQIDHFNKQLDAGVKLLDIVASLKAVCEAVSVALSHEFFAGAVENLEGRLWAVHTALNQRFREAFKRQDATGETNLAKIYLKFIKSSQCYYRDHIRELNHRFGCEEFAVLTTPSSLIKDGLQKSEHIDKDLRNFVLVSCYDSLIALGDLSRWRELLFPGSSVSWSPARSAYYLASLICPESGEHHHQLALTFIAEEDHFNALYHLSRSRSTLPQNDINLRREIRKISAADESNVLKDSISRHQDPGNTASLVAAVINAYCIYFSRKELDQFALTMSEEFFELSTSILRSDVREEMCNLPIIRMVIMTIAMEQSHPIFSHYNLRFCTILFDAFFDEFMNTQESLDSSYIHSLWAEKLSKHAQYLLHPIRIHSLWLVTNCESLRGNRKDKYTTRNAWRSYAKILTLLANEFPLEELPTVDYLLEEDEETLGLSSLLSEETSRIWKNGSRYKSRMREELTKLTPEIESLARIRDLLIDGLGLALEAEAPLRLDGTTFSYDASHDT